MSARTPLFVLAVAAIAQCACLEPDRGVLATKDLERPELLETDPQPGGVFDKDGGILVTFSERMEPRSLRPGLWLQEGSTRVPTVIEVPPEPANTPDAVQQTNLPYTVRVRGEQPLKPNATYTLVLEDVLTDTEGNQMLGADGGSTIVLTFRTGP